MTIHVALDLGSRYLAAVAATAAPTRIIAAAPIDVDPQRELSALKRTEARWSEIIRAACDEVIGLIEAIGATVVIIEWAEWHPMGGGNPAAEMGWKKNHDVLNEQRRIITEACAARGIAAHLVNPRTWRFRVVPLSAHPDRPREVSDADVLATLPAHLDAHSMRLLTDEHLRDAAGVFVGWTLAPEEKPKRERPAKESAGKGARKRNPETVRLAAERAKRRKLEARIASGCTCVRSVGADEAVEQKPGRHFRTCPVFVAMPPRGLRGGVRPEVDAALAEMFGR